MVLTRRKVFLGVLATTIGAGFPALAASWVDLGFSRVSLGREVDRIDVAAHHRRLFTKLRLAVDGNDIFLHTMTVHFVKASPVTYRFDTLIKDGRRSSSIDLMGEGRRVEHVDLAYRRAAGGGVAVVTLQGLSA